MEIYVWGLFCIFIYLLLLPEMQLCGKQTRKRKGAHAAACDDCLRRCFAYTRLLSRSALPGTAFGIAAAVTEDQRCSFMKREGQNLVRTRVCVLLPVGGVRARRVTARRCCLTRTAVSSRRQHALLSLHWSWWIRVVAGRTEAFLVICSHGYTVHTAFRASPPDSLSLRSSGELRVVYLSMGSAAMAKACTCKWLAQTSYWFLGSLRRRVVWQTDRQRRRSRGGTRRKYWCN